MNWEPIETAPQDETDILLYYPEVNAIAIAYWFHGGWSIDCVVGKFESEVDGTDPTHWMHLPDVPNT